jgi:hypothetical protein
MNIFIPPLCRTLKLPSFFNPYTPNLMKPGRGSGSFLVEFSSSFIELFANPHHRGVIQSRTSQSDCISNREPTRWIMPALFARFHGEKILIAYCLYAQQTLDRWIVETHSVERSNQKSYTSIPAIDHPASPYLGQALRPEIRFRKCIPLSWAVKGKSNLITTSCCSAVEERRSFPGPIRYLSLFFPC